MSAIMPWTRRPRPRRISDGRARGTVVTTIVLVLLSIMIVRDILVRRWGSGPDPRSDVTQRSL
jgi:hypothetical protein